MITLKYLKENSKLIHYFGLGFIQIKLSDTERVHFYTQELPAIIGLEDIHDHRYDFESTILKGYLKHETFELTEGNEFIMEQESCNPDVKIDGNSKLVGVRLNLKNTYEKYSTYFIPHTTLHRVKSNNGITHIKRGEYKKDAANVIRKVNAEKICPFSKKIEEVYLWTIVEEMLK